MTDTQARIMALFNKHKELTNGDISAMTGLARDTVERNARDLSNAGRMQEATSIGKIKIWRKA